MEQNETGREPEPPPTGPPTLNSQTLFATGREVIIEHGHDRYRLRLTSSNKLILIK